ncbi:MAG: HNH endonuclease [Deltaproteobacteria bacterium]|nr:HNH endonuclease [Deltaproteobacteria bacterium]MBW2530009.1 HNH endonuclease [Deltaproteobacteria bacterium]
MLNRVFQPARVTTARRAMRMLFTGTARALDADGELYDFDRWRRLPVRVGMDDGLPIVGGVLRLPRIVLLRRFARVWRPAVRLTRRNVMLRDEHRCQYCGRTASERSLNIDHVLPRARGGGDRWENLVTACQACNRRKGKRTPREAGMPLLRGVQAPHWSLTAQLLCGRPAAFPEWEPFLGSEARPSAIG